MPRTADERTWGGQELGERHREVLRVAMHLFAERGYAGASLRELARRLGIQQPSLYHYFRSKEELVDQILTTFGFGGVHGVPPGVSIPDHVEDLPRALGDIVEAMYERTDWPIFVRFLFNLSLEQQPQYGERLRVLFVETVGGLFDELLSHYVKAGEIDATDATFLARMVVNAIGLLYIEQKVVFPQGVVVDPSGKNRGHQLRPYIDFVVRVAEIALDARDPEGRIVRTPRTKKRGSTPPAGGDRSTRARGRRAGR